jgi:hypothetical protein
MKVQWQADDITPGRVLGKPGRSERWMIGYEAMPDDADRRHVLISLSDGLVSPPATAEMMAIDLNKSGEIPIELLGALTSTERTPGG